MLALGVHAIQRVLGLKRAGRHKVLPALILLISFVPALVFVGMAAFLPNELIEEGILPSYSEYNAAFIVSVIWLFTSFVAPEAICTDRRTGMLALYLASPLNRTTYIAAKVGAVTITMLAITLVPTLFLLVAYTIEGAGPDSIGGFLELLARITAGGILLAAYFGAFSAMVSSFTSRRSIASASIVISFLLAGAVTTALIEADVNDHIALLQIAVVPMRAATYLLGEQPQGAAGLSVVDGGLALLTTLGITALCLSVTWWRYQTLEVDR
jgi:ABC-2 type transport system permease protein